MKKNIGQNALTTNPALKPFEVLLGEWQTTGSHPYFPDMALTGRAVFEWLENGAFLIARSEIDHPQFPDGIEIFGSDDSAGTFFMLHFDERGTSRKFDVSMDKGSFTWRRDDPHFPQRFTLRVLDDGQRLESTGEMSRDGKAWEGDLSLVYTRVKQA
jgi:hypothetical protein